MNPLAGMFGFFSQRDDACRPCAGTGTIPWYCTVHRIEIDRQTSGILSHRSWPIWKCVMPGSRVDSSSQSLRPTGSLLPQRWISLRSHRRSSSWAWYVVRRPLHCAWHRPSRPPQHVELIRPDVQHTGWSDARTCPSSITSAPPAIWLLPSLPAEDNVRTVPAGRTQQALSYQAGSGAPPRLPDWTRAHPANSAPPRARAPAERKGRPLA